MRTTTSLCIVVAASLAVTGCTKEAGQSSAGGKGQLKEAGVTEVVVHEADPGTQVAIDAPFLPQTHFNKAGSVTESDTSGTVEELIGRLSTRKQNGDIIIQLAESLSFDENRSDLKESSHKELDTVAEILAMISDDSVAIIGHTDNKGDDNNNLELSKARARAVLEYLTSKGIDESRLTSDGKGESEPLVPNQWPNGLDRMEHMTKNRRVEITINDLGKRTEDKG